MRIHSVLLHGSLTCISKRQTERPTKTILASIALLQKQEKETLCLPDGLSLATCTKLSGSISVWDWQGVCKDVQMVWNERFHCEAAVLITSDCQFVFAWPPQQIQHKSGLLGAKRSLQRSSTFPHRICRYHFNCWCQNAASTIKDFA